MELTWKAFFHLTGEMFERNQSEIAGLLGVDASTISRLVTGKVKRLSCKKNDELYKDLFDPANDKSPAYNKNEKDLLDDFKAIIKKNDYEDGIKDLKAIDDYKSFIMGMLRSIKENQPPRVKPSGKKESSLRHSIKSENALQNAAAPIQTKKAFEEAFHDCRISDFLAQNLQEGINSGLLSLVDQFIETVESIADKVESADNKEAILAYAKILFEYKKYMEENFLRLQSLFLGSAAMPKALGITIIPISIKTTVRDEYLRYRQQLEALYNKICHSNSE